jgi:hypothetical protein
MATVKIGARPATEIAGSPKIEDLKSISGALLTSSAGLSGGEDVPQNRLIVEQRWAYARFNANAGPTTFVTGTGVIGDIIVMTAGATNSITLYDSSANAATGIIGVISTNAQATIPLNIPYVAGITYTLAGGTAADVLIKYRPDV